MTAVADAVLGDTDLVLAAQAGDRDAFRQLFDRHVHRVTGVCRQRLRCASDVDDAVQESFVRALTKIGQLAEPERFGAWVRAIAVRVCLDHHRASRRVLPGLESSDGAEIRDDAPLPDELFEVQERGAAARGHLRQIGDRDRRALWLRHVDEVPISTVALELGLTEGSTRVMLARARERLRAVTTSLPALLPLSWRTWVRDHLPAATPSIEAVVVALTVGVMAVALPGADAQEPAARPPAATAPTGDNDDDKHAAAARSAQSQRRQHAPRRHQPSASTAPSRPSAPAPRSSAPAPASGPEARLGGVEVDDEYPQKGESDEMVDLTVFATSEDGREEGSVRVYAKELGPAGEAAYDVVADTVPGGDTPGEGEDRP